MNIGRTGPEEPKDYDAAFAEIVAGWKRESETPRWPDDDELDQAGTGGIAEKPRETPTPSVIDAESGDVGDGQLAKSEADDEGHYVPPEPPPLPTLRPATLGALGVVVLGVFFVLSPSLLYFDSAIMLPLGLVCIGGGIVWLLSRLRTGPSQDDGWDDGAQV